MIRIKLFEMKYILLLTLTTTVVVVEMLKTEDNPKKAMRYLDSASGVLGKAGAALELIDMVTKEEDDADEKLDQILNEIKDVSGKVDNVENHLSNQIINLRLILTKTLRQSHVLDKMLRDLKRLINSVDLIWKNHFDYAHPTRHPMPPDHITLEFVENILSTGPDNLRDILHQIRVLISPNPSDAYLSKGFLNLLSEETANSIDEACGATFSAQKRIYEIYLMLILTEKKGLDVIDYAYTQRQKLTNATHDWGLETANKNTNERLKSYFLYLSKAMQQAPRDIRPCDPEKHKRNVTFIEFERLFGLYVINQKDNLHIKYLKCKGLCEDNNWQMRNNPENPKTTEVSSAFPSVRGWDYTFEDYCYGTLTNCWTIEDANYCQIPGSSRRFEWIKDKNGYAYGNDKAGCPNGVQNYRERWIDWRDSYADCDYCMCQCTLVPGAPRGIILISLMEQVADIDNNKVVTGVRFALNGGIVFLQIKEGVLLERGRIKNSQWKPIMNITNQRNRIIKQLQDDGSYAQLKRGEHYEALSSNAKTLFLDDIVVPNQYVVTGVQIRAEGQFSRGEIAFYLEVLATPFDYLTGKLNISEEYTSLWFSDVLMEMMKAPEYLKARSELVLNLPDNPLKSEINTVDSKPNQFVQFKYSDAKLDAGQTVVPLIDIQPVEATPDTPLSGIGILHKGAPGYGGFIAPRIFTYDFSPYIKPRAFRAQHLKP